MTILHIADDLQRIAYLRISSVYEVLFVDIGAWDPALALEVGDVVPFGIMVYVPHLLSHQDHEPVAASSRSVQEDLHPVDALDGDQCSGETIGGDHSITSIQPASKGAIIWSHMPLRESP